MAVIRAEQFQANDVFSFLLQFIKKNLNYSKFICYSKLVSKYYLQLVVNNGTDFFFPACRITRSISQIKTWGTERRLTLHKTSSKYHLPVGAPDHTRELSGSLQVTACAHRLKESVGGFYACRYTYIHIYASTQVLSIPVSTYARLLTTGALFLICCF